MITGNLSGCGNLNTNILGLGLTKKKTFNHTPNSISEGLKLSSNFLRWLNNYLMKRVLIAELCLQTDGLLGLVFGGYSGNLNGYRALQNVDLGQVE